LGIASVFPSRDFLFEDVNGRNPTIQTLPREHGEFKFDYIEPTAVLGGVVELQPVENSSGFLWREGLVQGRWGMGIEIVQDNLNVSSVREQDIDEVLHTQGEVFTRAIRRGFEVPPALQGLKEAK
jgi:hypothetical protein